MIRSIPTSGRPSVPAPRGGWILLLLLALAWAPAPAAAQKNVPADQVHLSVTLGGYILLGVGYTHWMEEHHALEFTVFPFAQPGEGIPFGLRLAHAWIPSSENWRAKLGAGLTVILRPNAPEENRFTPILAFTPGIHYDATAERTFRTDLWMSYYLKERVFAPTAIEFISGWRK